MSLSLDLLQVDFTSLSASGANFLGREAAEQATKSREFPRHVKSDEGLFLKVYRILCSQQNPVRLQHLTTHKNLASERGGPTGIETWMISFLT